MNAIRAILGWVFRNAILFVLIIAALIVRAIWCEGQTAESNQTSAIAIAIAIASEIASIEKIKSEASIVREEVEKTATAAASELKKYQDGMRGASIDKLKRERARTAKEIGDVRKTLASDFEVTRQVLARDTEALKKTALSKINLARLERQFAFLEDSIDIARGNGPTLARIADLQTQLGMATNKLERHRKECVDKSKKLNAFDKEWLPKRIVARVRDERGKIAAARTTACLAYGKAKADRQSIQTRIATARKTLETGAATIETEVVANIEALEELERQSNERQAQLKAQLNKVGDGAGTFAERYDLKGKARSALLFLLAIILTPFLIRTLFYYVLAPLAERRASIRITVPGNGGSPLPPAEPSRISLSVILAAGEELLIRQDYLQTSPMEAEKATRWLLDYRHPLSSIASGLFFLTRLRGGGSTTISAVKDPFAELARIDLPQGASCVLHPRALVALVQPIGQTMRITSHWRLFSLNAWLTMQLRFFVFHGPGCLIVRGGRGVRVEPAATGRIFGQDQLVGFSADLAYSVTRTETFAPYLFGREQLFKDKVEQGAGVLIIEEAPLAGRKGGEVRRGLEGAFDAGLKAFGL